MLDNPRVGICHLMAERYDTKSNVMLGGFRSQLEVSYVSTHNKELWYNETVCLWMTVYIYIYIYICVCVCVRVLFGPVKPVLGVIANHKFSFSHEYLKHQTALSKHFWSLKNKGLTPEIQWSILKKSNTPKCFDSRCKLCLEEKKKKKKK